MKKAWLPILAALALLMLSGCAVSREELAAKGIYAEEYSNGGLAASLEHVVLQGETELEQLFYGKVSKLDELSENKWQQGYVCNRFIEWLNGEYTQLDGYLSAHYSVELKDAALLAAMPRNGAELAVYDLTEADVERCLMSMFESNSSKALFAFRSTDDLKAFDDAVYDAVVSIQKASFACEYLTDQLSWVVTSYDDITELELTVEYTDGITPLAEIPVAKNRFELLEAVIACWEEDMFAKAAVLLDGLALDGEGLLAVLDVAESNCSLVPCEANKIWYEQYAMQDGKQIVRAWMELPLGEELIPLRQELIIEVSRRADNITSKHSETEKLYRAVYREVISAASYDNDMFDATMDEDLTDEMRIGRTAYGALIDGSTVCSGYARAYKALCDEIGLDCYVMIGTQDGDGHAWNVVYIDGETRYVDCSFADTGGGSKYCLFDEAMLKEKDYELNDNFHIENW